MGSQVNRHVLEATRWHHFQCFPKMRSKKWFAEQDFDARKCVGFESLPSDVQEQVVTLFEVCKGSSAVMPEEPRLLIDPETPASAKSVGAKKRATDPTPEKIDKTIDGRHDQEASARCEGQPDGESCGAQDAKISDQPCDVAVNFNISETFMPTDQALDFNISETFMPAAQKDVDVGRASDSLITYIVTEAFTPSDMKDDADLHGEPNSKPVISCSVAEAPPVPQTNSGHSLQQIGPGLAELPSRPIKRSKYFL